MTRDTRWRAAALLMAGAFSLAIGWAANTGTQPPNFSKDIAPIFYQHCVQCHHPGTTAPFSAITYKELRPWAKSIREKVITRQMPPWSADPNYGKFKNDPHLSDQQIEIVKRWIDAGAPEGNPKDLPPVPSSAKGWHIGNPDMVLEMAEDFEVPADQELDMQYFILDPHFAEDKWVQAAEIMEGNAHVVHHATLYIMDPNENHYRDRDKQFPGVVEMPKWQFKPPRPYVPTEVERRLGVAEVRTHEPFTGIGHGEPPSGWGAGNAKMIKAGSKLVLQIHYHPSGKVEKDRSSVGLIFCKAPPENALLSLGVVNMNFTVPARDPNYEVRAEATFLQDVHIWSLQPHMHLRGKDMEYRVVYPDGRSEIILRVPHFDFNLQFWYDLAEPLALPKGSRMLVTAHFDNSANNKLNPNPNVDVRRGLQTTDEMMNGHVNMTVDGWALSKNGGKLPKAASESN